jgi:hypothetical protein
MASRLSKRISTAIIKSIFFLTHFFIVQVYGDPEVHPQPETYWGHVNPIGKGVFSSVVFASCPAQQIVF